MEIPDISLPEGKRPPVTIAGYLIAAVIGILMVWQIFLADWAGLPPAYNFWIVVGLMSLCGIIAIAGISMSLLESITLEQTHVRIRSSFGWAKDYGYHEITAIAPDGDKVDLVFKDGRRQTVKNLRLGEGLQLRKLNSFLSEKTRPALSILNADVPPEKKYLM